MASKQTRAATAGRARRAAVPARPHKAAAKRKARPAVAAAPALKVAPRTAVTMRKADRVLAASFGIREANLARRREFIRLSEDDRQVLLRLRDWAAEAAPAIAREFYEWQFTFGPTRTFFEQQAAMKSLPLPALREHLETTQAGYIRGVFEGAEQNWGLTYFEDRLVVGSVHDRINLPFKWYVGSYVELERLVRVYLRRSFKKADFLLAAEEAIFKVFNLDMQAIGDSFLLNTLESMGLNVEAISELNGGDKTEGLRQVKEAIRILIEQCTALADGRLNDAVFEQSAPCAGKFGDAFARIRENFRESMLRIAQSASALSASAEELTAVSQQMSGNAEETAVQANVVANASDDVSKRVAVVAASSEVLLASMREIF